MDIFEAPIAVHTVTDMFARTHQSKGIDEEAPTGKVIAAQTVYFADMPTMTDNINGMNERPNVLYLFVDRALTTMSRNVFYSVSAVIVTHPVVTAAESRGMHATGSGPENRGARCACSRSLHWSYQESRDRKER